MKRFPALIALAAFVAAVSACRKDPLPGPEPPPEELDEAAILAMVRTDVQNTAYYKDIYLDGGCELNPGIKENGVVINGRLPYAMAKTGITDAEYFLSTVDDVDEGYTDADQGYQNERIIGTPEDVNGVLLYPDGDPRFRLIYVFGGHSGPHGESLGTIGRSRVKEFYENGGSYVGSCAGAYLSGKFAAGGIMPYFNIWENGKMVGTNVGNSSIDLEMVSGVFADYYGPAEGVLVSGARHNGGGYMDTAPAGTEAIALFKNEKGKDSHRARFYDKPGVWAYKASAASGRVVVTGSHPEDAADGDVLNLTASMFRYAWDGSGTAKVKGVLRNGDMIPMTKGTDDNQPAYTAIGDRQCHHFVVHLSAPVKALTVEVQAQGDYDMEVYLKKDTFAFPDSEPDYAAKQPGGHQTLVTGALEAGLWYVTVRCATTVTATEVITDPAHGRGRRFVYSGKTGVLNGVPYTVEARW